MQEEAKEVIFGSIPAGIFRIFAGSSRVFFAELLAHLADDPFGQAGEIATRKRVQDSISAFIDRSGRSSVIDLLNEPEARTASVPSHITVYNRLIETGCLVEYRDRYRKIVDFDPAALLVLHI